MAVKTERDKLFETATLAIIDLSLVITAISVWGGSYKYLVSPPPFLLILCVLQLILVFGVDIIFLEYSLIKGLALTGLVCILMTAVLWAVWTRDMTMIFRRVSQQPFSFYQSFVLLIVVLGYITAVLVIRMFGKYLYELFSAKSREYRARNNFLFFAVYAVLGMVCLIISVLWPFKSDSSS